MLKKSWKRGKGKRVEWAGGQVGGWREWKREKKIRKKERQAGRDVEGIEGNEGEMRGSSNKLTNWI